MTLGQILYLILWMSLASGLVIVSWRTDAFTGRAVLIALIGYVLGGLALGVYLRDVRGRDYLAPDEQAFQVEAAHIVDGWRTGRPYTPTITDGWPYVNAVILRVWGPSLTPMRLLNALTGAATVAATYWLAQVVFESPPISRIAVLFVVLSPSLFVWSLTNLKERTLGLMIMLAIAAAVLLIKRWTMMRLAGLLGAIYSLGALRHYYAPMVGWLAIVGYAVCATSAWPRRLSQLAVLVVSLGLVLEAVTGTFLGANTPSETVTRYVWASAPSSLQAPSLSSPQAHSPDRGATSLLGDTSGYGERVSGFDLSRFTRSVLFVLVGGFDARDGTGRVFELINWPEWLANFVLLPLAFWAFVNSVLRRQLLPILPAAFVAGLVLVLAYTHGDDWSTFRFRVVYWPVYLMLAAAGAVQLSSVRAFHRRIQVWFSSTTHQPV